jgi:hypothetical protein
MACKVLQILIGGLAYEVVSIAGNELILFGDILVLVLGFPLPV